MAKGDMFAETSAKCPLMMLATIAGFAWFTPGTLMVWDVWDDDDDINLICLYQEEGSSCFSCMTRSR